MTSLGFIYLYNLFVFPFGYLHFFSMILSSFLIYFMYELLMISLTNTFPQLVFLFSEVYVVFATWVFVFNNDFY